MHSVKELFDDIVLLADILEKNAIDTFKFSKGIENEEIEEWEKRNAVKLPQGYKEFVVLANGFRYGGTQIFPMEMISIIDIPKEFEGYYAIGSYIGDGSLILSDVCGEFYYGDHAFGIEKADFSKFLEDDILDRMKDAFKDNGIEIPDNINTRETEEDKRKREEEIAEMLRKLKELREKESL